MHRPTIQVYERRAADYAAARPPRHGDRARRLAGQAKRAGGVIVDLGSGPGGYLSDLVSSGLPVVAFDGARAMLRLGGHPLAVQGELERLPLRRHSLAGAWARNSYLHVAAGDLPLALAGLHHALRPAAPVCLALVEGDGAGALDGDDLPGRSFTFWRRDRLQDVLAGAGFADIRIERVTGADGRHTALWASARRGRTLPDFVAPGMRLLVCGLNPSVFSADAGFGFARPTNRFWRAATAAGLISHPGSPWLALARDGIGMTDLCKRATRRASELSATEYRAGAARVGRLVSWLRPASVVFVGLDGWRSAIDRRAQPGWQPEGFAGVPAYVMPSTSGLNARVSLAELVGHLGAATGSTA